MELTRTGIVGLELTREEVIDACNVVEAIIGKAQCREVNCDIIDSLNEAANKLRAVDIDITDILEEVVNG